MRHPGRAVRAAGDKGLEVRAGPGVRSPVARQPSHAEPNESPPLPAQQSPQQSPSDLRALPDLLARLDAERRASGETDPADPPGHPGRLHREFSADRTECRIVHADLGDLTGPEVDALIQAEAARADAHGWTLEWKHYGHDAPADLPARLCAAGFEPDDAEQVLALPLTPATALHRPHPSLPGVRIQRVRHLRTDDDAAGLDGYAVVSREIGRRNVESEQAALAAVLRETPGAMTLYVAHVDGEPAACARAHHRPGGDCVELTGARTRTTRRRLGLFSDLVAAAVHDAAASGRTLALADALPTSEPTFRRLGFHPLTTTRPYLHEPAR